MTRRCTSVRLALLGALPVRVVLKGFLKALHLPPFLVESFAARRPAPQGKPLLDPSHSWKADGPCIAPFHASTVLSAAAKVRPDQPPKSCFSKRCTLGREVKTQSTVGLDPLNRRLARLTSRWIRWVLDMCETDAPLLLLLTTETATTTIATTTTTTTTTTSRVSLSPSSSPSSKKSLARLENHQSCYS